MLQHSAKLFFILLTVATGLHAQEAEVDGPIKGELKMTFPSIYFKSNSTDYAVMPYKSDSCLKYIAIHFKDNINSLVIWRDSIETEELTTKRIKKIKAGLNKYIPSNKIEIHSMGNEQKISRHTIETTSDSSQIKYLISLNSVFDFSRTYIPEEKKSVKKNSEKHMPRLVWTGWKTGFHWSTPGKTKINTTNAPAKKKRIKKTHIEHPRFWCIKCWRNHRFSKEYKRMNEMRNNGTKTPVNK